MRLDFDRLWVRDEADVSQDTPVYALLSRWKNWGLKGATLLGVSDSTADMPLVSCYEERRFVERLSIFIGESVNTNSISPASLSLLLFPYPFDSLWFIDGIEGLVA